MVTWSTGFFTTSLFTQYVEMSDQVQVMCWMTYHSKESPPPWVMRRWWKYIPWILCNKQNVNKIPFSPLHHMSVPASALVLPWAQQDPQYWGMCWLRVVLTKLVPLTFLQSQAVGSSTTFIYSWKRGTVLRKFIHFNLAQTQNRTGENPTTQEIGSQKFYIISLSIYVNKYLKYH